MQYVMCVMRVSLLEDTFSGYYNHRIIVKYEYESRCLHNVHSSFISEVVRLFRFAVGMLSSTCVFHMVFLRYG